MKVAAAIAADMGAIGMVGTAVGSASKLGCRLAYLANRLYPQFRDAAKLWC